MEKLYSPEKLLQVKHFNRLSIENAKTFLLSLIYHLENLWGQEPLHSQLTEVLTLFLQSQSLPSELEDDDLGPTIRALQTRLSVKQFLSFVVPIERKLGSNLSEHQYLIDTQDKKTKVRATNKSPLFIIADNLRSAFNVGSIFRTGECIGAEHIYLCGYTAGPEKQKTKKSAMGTEELIPWSWQAKAISVIKSLQENNIPCIALETASPSTSSFDYKFPKSCALVIGNERYGLDQEVLQTCNHTVHIPVFGQKNSLNVGVALAVAAYEYKRQQHR